MVKKQQVPVDKENKALEEALNMVRKVQCRLDIQQKKVDEEKHVLGDLPWRQKRTMSECASETMKTLQHPMFVRCQQMRLRRVKFG